MKFPSNFSLKKLFFNNKFVISFSIVAAIVLWMSISIIEAPNSEFVIRNVPITIEVEGSAAEKAGLDIVNKDEVQKTVNVTVKGPKYVVSSLKPEDISVSASVAPVTTKGTYALELIAHKISNGEYEIDKSSLGTIQVRFDFFDINNFVVQPEIEGVKLTKESTDQGFLLRNAVVSDNKYTSVKIYGPEEELGKIDRVVAKATATQEISKSTAYTANIMLLDENNQEISKKPFTITASDNSEVTTVPVTVPVGKTKEVPIKLQFSSTNGVLDPDRLEYISDHQSIEVVGPPETIDKLQFLELEPINMFELSPDNPDQNVYDLKIIFPNGVESLDQIESVQVAFPEINSYRVRTFTVSNFKASDGVNAVLASPIKNVKICAPRAIMNRITAADLVATAKLEGKAAGDHLIEVVISFTKDDMAWQVGTYTATVTVK